MKISRTVLRKMIVEEMNNILSYDNPSDVEAVEDAMAGGDNLELPLDHASAMGVPEQPEDEHIMLIQIVREELARVNRHTRRPKRSTR
jgi:hypothetical protein